MAQEHNKKGNGGGRREVIILAGGKGTRMKTEFPKVLTEVAGRPLITHVVEQVNKLGLESEPIIVVGYKGDQVKDRLSNHSRFSHQLEQKGTGHAVMSARREALREKGSILILYGDQPLVKTDTLQKIFEAHENHDSPITIATTIVDAYDGWQKPFYDFGRIVRNEKGNVVGIIEKKDATDDQREGIREVNVAYYCVDADWLWNSLDKVTTNNVQGEYYLTDIVGIAFEEGHPIVAVDIPPKEALGVNSPEQLIVVENMFVR
ncbi:MAG: NTP transferase domain-containing protein [Patescibacteria group bacterium]